MRSSIMENRSIVTSRTWSAERLEYFNLFQPSRLLKNVKKSTIWVKLFHWEYWDFNLIYGSVFFLHLWQSFKARSFFYFSASNPGLENAGFIGERKSEIMKKIPSDLQPKWFLVENFQLPDLLNELEISGIKFPLICKPNVGERGKGVAKIENQEDLIKYHTEVNSPYLVQSFVPFPLEFGVFYFRIPGEAEGKVSSIVQKVFLSVEGDGISTLADLVENEPRARFVKYYLGCKFKDIWHDILAKGKKLELEGIGNHCRGTTFLNANSLITKELTDSFDLISKKIKGFYFGRYDIRVASIADLQAGHIQILELNGAGAEPAHIYQPGFSFFEGQKVLLRHWQALFEISRKNNLSGTAYWSYKEAKAIKIAHKKALHQIGI